MSDDNAGSAFLGKAAWSRRTSDYQHNKVGDNKCQSHNSKLVKNVKKEIRCYKCKRVGHYKSNCPDLIQKKGEKEKTGSIFNTVFLGSQHFKKTDWYLDSGASSHVTANKNWLTEVTSMQGPNKICFADQSKVLVECSGSLKITTVVEGKKFEIFKR